MTLRKSRTKLQHLIQPHPARPPREFPHHSPAMMSQNSPKHHSLHSLRMTPGLQSQESRHHQQGLHAQHQRGRNHAMTHALTHERLTLSAIFSHSLTAQLGQNVQPHAQTHGLSVSGQEHTRLLAFSLREGLSGTASSTLCVSSGLTEYARPISWLTLLRSEG